jgi:hypothetical protein
MARRLGLAALFGMLAGCHLSSSSIARAQLPVPAPIVQQATPGADPAQQVLLDQMHQMAEQDASLPRSRGAF